MKLYKMLCAFLAVVLLLGCFPFTGVSVNAANLTEKDFAMKVEALKKEYPDGKYWNDYNGEDSEGNSKAGDIKCYCSGEYCPGFCNCRCGQYKNISGLGQCHAFANLMADKFFGSYATIFTDEDGTSMGKNWKYHRSTSEYYAGDFIRIDGTLEGHTVFVIKVSGNMVSVVDCNRDGPCKIDWGKTYTKSELDKRVTYVARYNGNTLTGNGNAPATLSVLYHANGALIPDSEITACKYRVTETVGLNFRTGAGTGYSLIKTLPKNTEFTVNFGDTKEANGYTWGKTTIGSDTGWTVISQFVTKISDLRNQDYFLNESWICKNGENSAFRHQMTYGETYKYGLYDFDSFGLVKEGYRFVGWSRVPEGGGIIDQSRSLRPEEIVPELQEGSRTIHVYAVWEPIAPVLTGISVEKGPDKPVYQVCEALDVSGLKIRLSYDDGSYELIQSGFLVEGVVLDRIGEQRVRVYYGGFECSFNVCVQNILKGDANEDGIISLEDAIHLLFYINFPSRYRVNQDMDLDGNGKEELNDAVYLLYHVNFPAKYPII